MYWQFGCCCISFLLLRKQCPCKAKPSQSFIPPAFSPLLQSIALDESLGKVIAPCPSLHCTRNHPTLPLHVHCSTPKMYRVRRTPAIPPSPPRHPFAHSCAGIYFNRSRGRLSVGKLPLEAERAETGQSLRSARAVLLAVLLHRVHTHCDYCA